MTYNILKLILQNILIHILTGQIHYTPVKVSLDLYTQNVFWTNRQSLEDLWGTNDDDIKYMLWSIPKYFTSLT